MVEVILFSIFSSIFFFFFFNDTATTEIYTLSLHDALPICRHPCCTCILAMKWAGEMGAMFGIDHVHAPKAGVIPRSEEHTSELQSRQYLVCRLLLEKKKS